MSEKVFHIGDGFWNFRGNFKIAGIDIGTHASLVCLKSGGFAILDAYSFGVEEFDLIERITDGGEAIEAVINLHPFHTVHVETGFELFPNAVHYGTSRHHKLFPDLAWSGQRTESLVDTNPFSESLEFSIPQGVDFVAKNQNVHFSSVLALHKSSNTLHVDDTLMVLEPPGLLDNLLELFNLNRLVQFHPTLAMALKKESGSADQFKEWVNELCDSWGSELETICAAHNGIVSAQGESGALVKKIRRAAILIEPVLSLHRFRYG